LSRRIWEEKKIENRRPGTKRRTWRLKLWTRLFTTDETAIHALVQHIRISKRYRKKIRIPLCETTTTWTTCTVVSCFPIWFFGRSSSSDFSDERLLESTVEIIFTSLWCYNNICQWNDTIIDDCVAYQYNLLSIFAVTIKFWFKMAENRTLRLLSRPNQKILKQQRPI